MRRDVPLRHHARLHLRHNHLHAAAAAVRRRRWSNDNERPPPPPTTTSCSVCMPLLRLDRVAASYNCKVAAWAEYIGAGVWWERFGFGLINSFIRLGFELGYVLSGLSRGRGAESGCTIRVAPWVVAYMLLLSSSISPANVRRRGVGDWPSTTTLCLCVCVCRSWRSDSVSGDGGRGGAECILLY